MLLNVDFNIFALFAALAFFYRFVINNKNKCLIFGPHNLPSALNHFYFAASVRNNNNNNNDDDDDEKLDLKDR